MTELDLATIFATAIELEMTGLETYLRFGIRTKDVTGKNMYMRLAKDELDHLRIFEKYRVRLLAAQELAITPEEIKPIAFVKPELREVDVKTKGEEHADELTALQTALDLERRSIEFYANWASKTTDAELRRLLLNLKEVEESHFDLIQTEIDSLTGTGFWFGVPEFDLEAG